MFYIVKAVFTCFKTKCQLHVVSVELMHMVAKRELKQGFLLNQDEKDHFNRVVGFKENTLLN